MENKTPHNYADLTGEQFNRLTVVRRVGKKYGTQVLWECQCICGAVVGATTGSLRSGHTKSCGCLSIDRATKHGMHKSSEYLIWQQAKERCHNPKKTSYSRYGARGIYMVDEWRNDFQRFFADMGVRPSSEHTLERVDNDGPYAPWNCIRVTKEAQYRNRRQTVWLEFGGETLCKKDWCRRYNLDEATFAARLKRGWTLERALTTPAKKQIGKNS